jgi:ABC-type siderophore export system fused ATPase/permease subunit
MKLTLDLLRYFQGNPMLARIDGATNLLWLYIALSLLVPLTTTLSAYPLVKLGEQVVTDMQPDPSRAILRTALNRLKALGPQELLATLTDNVMTLAQASALVPAICLNGALIIDS